VPAVFILRSRDLPLFIEQLALPALLVGGASIGLGVFRDLPLQAAAFLLAMVTLAAAVAADRPWLRVLMGVALAILLALSCTPSRWHWFGGGSITNFWVAWHLVAAVTLAAIAVQAHAFSHGPAARIGAAIESIAAGMLVAVLAALAALSGMTFLAGASVGELGGLVAPMRSDQAFPVLQAGSAVLAALAAAWLARSWPAVRRAWCAAAAAVMVALSWYMPSLGLVLLILAVCLVLGRWGIAGAAAVAGAWIIGAFYYRLESPLATKAIVLLAAGALLSVLAWLAMRGEAASDAAPMQALPAVPHGAIGIALTLLSVLAVANWGIWQKEQIIAHGQPVFVELAPVDPRSLMQGDYMRLAFRMPLDVRTQNAHSTERPYVVGRRDARGVTTLVRLHDGSQRGADEILIELTPKDSRWVLVTDAWFFKEGEAQRWSPAKYGEFRVDSSGRALLVGLRDKRLNPL
jgi:uncharacterized membrane-anchored protein